MRGRYQRGDRRAGRQHLRVSAYISRALWKRVGRPRPRELDSRFLTMVDERPVCRDCWARYLCGGGCLHQAHTDGGTDAPLPQFCRMKRTLVEAAIVHLAEIGVHAAETDTEAEFHAE